MNEQDKGIVLLDFCSTCVPFESVTPFVKFCIERGYGNKHWLMLESLLYRFRVMQFLRKIPSKIAFDKALEIRSLKRISYKQLDFLAKQFYMEVLKPSLNSPVINYLRQIKEKNYRIILVSGAYDLYLKYFVHDFGIENLVSSEFKFDNRQFFTGKLRGKDRMGSEKVNRVKALLNKELIDITASDSICISDSKSDIPLFSMCNKRVCALNRNKYIDIPEWVKIIDGLVIWY